MKRRQEAAEAAEREKREREAAEAAAAAAAAAQDSVDRAASPQDQPQPQGKTHVIRTRINSPCEITAKSARCHSVYDTGWGSLW